MRFNDGDIIRHKETNFICRFIAYVSGINSSANMQWIAQNGVIYDGGALVSVLNADEWRLASLNEIAFAINPRRNRDSPNIGRNIEHVCVLEDLTIQTRSIPNVDYVENPWGEIMREIRYTNSGSGSWNMTIIRG